jgi:Survival protein SurE
MARQTVLVSNDDGIAAPGIVALVRHLVAAGCCQVTVVAPASEQSAKSQALTLGHAFVAENSDYHSDAHASLAVHGTPADAVMVALGCKGSAIGVCCPLVLLKQLHSSLHRLIGRLLHVCTFKSTRMPLFMWVSTAFSRKVNSVELTACLMDFSSTCAWLLQAASTPQSLALTCRMTSSIWWCQASTEVSPLAQ